MNRTVSIYGASEAFILRAADGREDVPVVGELHVGREDDCDIQIQDKRISRYHARISLTERGVLVQDLHSTNGSFVNGVRVDGEQLARPGDELRFYDQAFELLSDSPGSAEATVFSPALKTELIQALREPQPDPAVESSAGADQSEAMPGALDKAAVRRSGDQPRRPEHKLSAIQRQERKHNRQHDSFIEQVRKLSAGDWLDFERDNGEHLFFCKLLTGTEDPCSLYFVSRSGFGALEVSVAALAAEFEHGRCQVMERGPLLGRLLLLLSGGPSRVPRER